MSTKDVGSVFTREQSASEHPWSMRNLSQSIESKDDCQVACLHTTDVGYFVLQHNEGVSEILNFVVFLEHQRKGIGRELLALIVSLATRKKSSEVWLEVREGNRVARKLYKSAGFVQQGVRKNYYPEASENSLSVWEDAVLMAYAIPSRMVSFKK